MQIRTILVDDEQDSVKLLQLMLAEYCPTVKVEMTFNNPAEAIAGINKLKPDLLFLDIEMPGLNGFMLLEQLETCHPSVIFLTAYNQFAINAFRVSALDYLLKPLQKDELINAVNRFVPANNEFNDQLSVLKTTLEKKTVSKIAIPANNGTAIVDTSEILFIESDKNYSTIHLATKKYMILRSLKEIEAILQSENFYRIHRQYIVNVNAVKTINRTDSCVILSNGQLLPVGRQQKDEFERLYKWL